MTSKKSTTQTTRIVLVIDNLLYKLDETLLQVYNKNYDASPTLDTIYQCPAKHVSTDMRHKLWRLMLEEPLFFRNLPIVPNAREILQEMLSFEQRFPAIDIRICTCVNPAINSIFFQGMSSDGELWDFDQQDPDLVTTAVVSRIMKEKIDWLQENLASRQVVWFSKLMFIDQVQSDPSRRILGLSDADVVIQSFLHCYHKSNAAQIQLLFMRNGFNNSAEYLRLVQSASVIPIYHLKDWKKLIQFTLDPQTVLTEDKRNDETEITQFKSFVHGSHDSNDIDRLYLIPGDDLPSIAECTRFAHSSGIEDRNLFVVNPEGYVTDVFKGLVDEVNNAFFSTYPLHQQEHECPVKGKINRCIVLKVCMTLSNLLIKVRRTSMYKEESMNAVRSFDFNVRRDTLKIIDYRNLKDHLNEDDIKYCAFRLGQTIALLNGTETNTKSAVAEAFPDLRPLLYRDPSVDVESKLDRINHYKEQLLESIRNVTVLKNNSLHLFQTVNNSTAQNMNLFEIQSNGLIIDMKDTRMRCQFFPPIIHISPDLPILNTQWPNDQFTIDQVPTAPDCILVNIFEYLKRTTERKPQKKKKKNVEEEEPESASSQTVVIMVTTSQDFETEDTRRLSELIERDEVNIDLKKVDFGSYMHTFAYNRLNHRLDLVAMRSRVTLLIVDPNIVAKMNMAIHRN